MQYIVRPDTIPCKGSSAASSSKQSNEFAVTCPIMSKKEAEAMRPTKKARRDPDSGLSSEMPAEFVLSSQEEDSGKGHIKDLEDYKSSLRLALKKLGFAMLRAARASALEPSKIPDLQVQYLQAQSCRAGLQTALKQLMFGADREVVETKVSNILSEARRCCTAITSIGRTRWK